MNTEKKALPSIHVQAAMALMLIQLVHKIVREIPGAFHMGGPGVVGVPVFAALLAVGILLLVLRIKWGLILGMIDGAFMIFQPILVHIILAHPDQNGIWWYPVFPWTQAILIIYFCCMAWKNWQ
ncbi:MAG: hypothetical protein K8S27_08885 [Candidatus Omnitrophica bacterium]|nr:hypothetical protein [Candidatus Omnitrophota bacterium]